MLAKCSSCKKPGLFFTVIQFGLNAVAILSDAAFSPYFKLIFDRFLSLELAEQVSFICFFVLVTPACLFC